MAAPYYPSILSKRYPTLQWKMTGNDLATLVMISGVAPTQAQMDALWPGVESELNSELDVADKMYILQQNYSLQIQLIECMKAISTNDKTVVNSILSTWENL